MKMILNKVEERWSNQYSNEGGYIHFFHLLGAKVRRESMDAGNLYSARVRPLNSWHSSEKCIFEIYEKDGHYVVDFWGYKYGNRFYTNERYLKKYSYYILAIANAILATRALPYSGKRLCEA